MIDKKTSNNVFNSMIAKTRKVFLHPFSSSHVIGTRLGAQRALAFTLQANVEAFGFTFSKDVILNLSHMNIGELSDFWQQLQPQLASASGGHVSFRPMYPNFPSQVINASNEELMLNAFMHYAGDWFGLRVLPEYTEKIRLPLVDKVKPKMLDLATEDDVTSLFSNLLSSNTAFSESDREHFLHTFNYLNATQSAENIINQSVIPQKENLAFIGKVILDSNLDFNLLLAHRFSTPTDTLRLCAAMFNGDTSLAAPTRVGKLSRPMRKALMSMLERQLLESNDQSQLIENFFSKKEAWVRLGHAMHIGEHSNKFPLLASVFEDLRSNNAPTTFNSKVENLLQSKDVSGAVSLLAQRPGVFGRAINRLCVLAKDDNQQTDFILDSFKAVANDIATPVLLQMQSHFLHQHEKSERIFMPKGGIASLFMLANDDAFTFLSIDTSLRIAEICDATLVKRFSALPPLGNVYIDPELKLQNVPFAQRSASKALNSVSRGSRFDLAEKNKDIIRLFLWWNQTGLDANGAKKDVGRVDIDLSCVILDKNFKTTQTCNYWNLRSGALTHSGDITSAPNGACEFIDIDLTKISAGERYVAMTLSAYTNQKYSDLPECFAGWMIREKAQLGEIFDPRTVKNKIDLTAESTQMMPAIFDTKTRQFIWADLSIKANDRAVNNIHSNLTTLETQIRAVVNMIKPNLFDLFSMHAKGRGNIVTDKAAADTVFSLNEGITPYMFDVISSDFMPNVETGPILAAPAPQITVKKRKI